MVGMGISGAMVAEAVTPGTAEVTYVPGWDDAAPTVARIAQPGDLVVTLGCGDVTKVAPLIVTGSARILPKHGKWVRAGHVTVRALPPFNPHDTYTLKEREAFKNDLWARMDAAYQEMRQ